MRTILTMASSVPGDAERQAVDGLSPALLHALERRLRARARTRRVRLQLQPGAAGLLGERYADDFLEHGGAMLVICDAVDHQALGRHQLAVAAAHPVVPAVRRAHAQAEHAARPRVGLAGMRGEILRPEPVRELLGARPGLEYADARRGEKPRQRDRALMGPCGRGGSGHDAL